MPKKSLGRPPSGLGKSGEPNRIRDYPTLRVTIRPVTKARLFALAKIEARPAWKVIEASINCYFEQVAPKDRRAAEALAKKSAG